MSSIKELKSAGIAPPFGDGTNDSNQLCFTVGEASTVNALPDSWAGEYVTMRCEGVDGYFMISSSNSASVAVPTPAEDGGADATMGFLIKDGETVAFMLPSLPNNDSAAVSGQKNYLVRISSSGDGAIYCYRSSGVRDV